MSETEKNSSFHQKQQVGANSLMTPEQLRRLELLKLQKELQRREREREAWRAASTPRNVFAGNDQNNGPRGETDTTRKAGNSESPFFAKLRRGKLLE